MESCLFLDHTSLWVRVSAMITIGLVLRGPEIRESPLGIIASKLLLNAEQMRGDLRQGEVPFVNIVYDIPGSLGAAPYVGERIGHYSKKDKGVVVSFAVPMDITSANDYRGYFSQTMRQGVERASEFFCKRGQNFPLTDALALAAKIVEDI